MRVRPHARHAFDTQMMQIDMKSLHDEDAQIGALVSAATLRVVRSVSVSRVSRRSSVGDRGLGGRKSVSGGAVTVDDTLDMIKLVIVGDSGVGKTCLMLRFVKDEFVTSTRATIGMECARASCMPPQLARAQRSSALWPPVGGKRPSDGRPTPPARRSHRSPAARVLCVLPPRPFACAWARRAAFARGS